MIKYCFKNVADFCIYFRKVNFINAERTTLVMLADIVKDLMKFIGKQEVEFKLPEDEEENPSYSLGFNFSHTQEGDNKPVSYGNLTLYAVLRDDEGDFLDHIALSDCKNSSDVADATKNVLQTLIQKGGIPYEVGGFEKNDDGDIWFKIFGDEYSPTEEAVEFIEKLGVPTSMKYKE